MSVGLDVPQIRRSINDLIRRVGILERRTQPAIPTSVAGGDGHDGAGDHAVAVAHSGDTATATTSNAIAIGHNASAGGTDDNAIALGELAEAVDTGIAVGYQADASGGASLVFGNLGQATTARALALGHETNAGGVDSIALGTFASAAHDKGVAIGWGAETTNDYQINMGRLHLITGAPGSAPADADLIGSQLCFYLDEDANTLKVKVKKSGGTVMTGTITLT